MLISDYTVINSYLFASHTPTVCVVLTQLWIKYGLTLPLG